MMANYSQRIDKPKLGEAGHDNIFRVREKLTIVGVT
jgi:hypothetical protein